MGSLINLLPGETGLVRHLDGERGVVTRLAAMGFTPGAPLTVIRNSEHGPLLVNLRGVQIALGRGEAQRIQVSPPPETTLETPPVSRVIALAGQPNVGKSTVFNMLTGLNQHVGNWSGKTVEQKTGIFHHQSITYSLVDLPGTYSLTANSDEERIARDFILHEKPDLVVAVVDAATLERNLYLLAELLLLPAPVILALNMMDVARQEGIQVEPEVLESALGIPVVPMEATRNLGFDRLLETIAAMLDGSRPYQPRRPSILSAHQAVLDELCAHIRGYVPAGYPEGWVALKLLEGDEELLERMRTLVPPEHWTQVGALLYAHEDAVLDIAGARYEWIARMIRAAVVQPQVGRVGMTARLDRVATHPLWGVLALAAILGGVFWLTYSVGGPIQGWLSDLLQWLADGVRGGLSAAPAWLVDLLADGVLGGVGMVLTFLPILAIFFTALGFLEDTGYMARVAYLTDRWMHMMGLHGKSFLPLLLGFGCNVPAVLGTRIIEDRRARLLTMMLVPFVPCTARMAVVTVLVPLFFVHNAAWVAWGLVAANLALLVGLGLTLHSFVLKNDHVAFIMELPLYHLPNPKTIGLYVWHNLLGFLEKAGTVILLASLVVWGLSYFPNGAVMDSYLAVFGRALEPVGAWMGLPWPVLLALITSLVAKENTIATLAVLYGNLNTALPALLSPAAGLAMLVFQMLFIPCIATVASIRQETRSWAWTALSVGLMVGLAFGLSVATYQIASLLGG